jgi:hypothetical protein
LDQKYNKIVSKNNRGLACFLHFFDPVPQVMFLKVPWLTLAPFWLPFGSLFVSFWFRWDRFGYPFLIHFERLTVRFFFIVYLTPLPSGCALSALAH